MNRIDIRTFRKLLQTTFHVKRINAFIHRILIPHADYNRLVRFENFLINIAGHFTDRSLIFATIPLSDAFRLTFSGQIDLPPVISIINQHIITISSPTSNTTSRCRIWFVISFLEYRIPNSCWNIGNLTRFSVKLIPYLCNRIIHHSPFTVHWPLRSCPIATSYQLLFSRMYIHRIDVKRHFIKPVFLRTIRRFVCVKHIMNLFRTIRLQQISMPGSYFRQFSGSNVIDIFRILRTEITTACLQSRYFIFIPGPQLQLKTLIRLYFLFFLIFIYFFLIRSEFHCQKLLATWQVSPDKFHPCRENYLFSVKDQITGVLL